MAALNDQVLVLNRAYVPVDVITVKKAISSSYKDIASIVDSDYAEYHWEEWYELFSIPVETEFEEETRYIKDKFYKIRTPEVIILNDFTAVPKRAVKLTRRHLYIRDRGICQYTGKKLTPQSATWDHVIPRSRGGKNTWENLVLCDEKVNVAKSNRTPEEAGLKLLREPKKPRWHPVYASFLKKRPESWYKFVKKEDWELCYWDAELED